MVTYEYQCFGHESDVTVWSERLGWEICPKCGQPMHFVAEYKMCSLPQRLWMLLKGLLSLILLIEWRRARQQSFSLLKLWGLPRWSLYCIRFQFAAADLTNYRPVLYPIWSAE
jgi:hypothetical protein